MSQLSRPSRDAPRPSVDARRLWDSLAETANFGGTERGGLHRLALTVADRDVRRWLARAAAASGWGVRSDEIGNQIIVKPGTRPELAPVLIGSHLDSQPLGGRFDGVYGVLAGLEVLRALAEQGIAHERTILLANWTNEEGARFSPSMMGSAVFAGALSLEDALGRTDAEGVSVASALEHLKIVPTGEGEGPAADWLHATIEIHIEQGPYLEQAGIDIGLVTGVQAIRWLDVSIIGASGHAGTTPIGGRRDALVSAARLIAHVAELGELVDPDIRPTVGEIAVTPNSRNVIPGSARLAIDLRHPDVRVLDRAEQEIREAGARISAASGTETHVESVLVQPAVAFDPGVLQVVADAVHAAGLTSTALMSGAGHDAMQLAPRAPTAMIFIPCIDGLSHAEAENITPEWSANGAQVLLDVACRLSGAAE